MRRRQTHMRQRDAGSVLQGKPFRPSDNSPFRRHLHLKKMRHTDPYSALFSFIIYTVSQNATVFTQKKRDRRARSLFKAIRMITQPWQPQQP